MKNFNLLLATTAILSMGAMATSSVANAGYNVASTTFTIGADIASAITSDPGVIHFGGFLALNNGIVELNSDGTYGEGTTVTLIGSTSEVSPAKFKGGPIAANGSNYSKFSGVLSAADNKLYKHKTSIVCGSINVSDMSVISAADATYGGIKMTPQNMVLTLANDIESNFTEIAPCDGQITLTLVYDPS